MRLHPRTEIVREAEIDLLEVLIEWQKRHPELTYVEQACVYVSVAANPQSPLKYALRMERHGNDHEPAGVE